MTLTLDDFNGMELMWKQLPKSPDDDHVTLTRDDIDSMWNCGIVDTRQYSIEAWRAAFDGNRQTDGTYITSKEDFLGKEEYRYKGEILVPFDAMLINEGKYTDEGLHELFDISVKPSCSLSAPEIKKFLDDIRTRYRDKDNLIKIDKPAKITVRAMIDDNPSPLRRLELMFDYLIQQDQIEIKKGIQTDFVQIPGQLSPEQIAKIQASSFSMQPSTDTEKKYKSLSKLEKIKPKEGKDAEGKKGVALKKVKRSRKGFRG